MDADQEGKKPYHHGNLKGALIAAGIELLDARGLEQLSLRAIAAHVGVSHTAPKNHFGSLRGLLTAMATEGFHRHTAMMCENAGPDQKSQQLAAMRGYVRFAAAHPHLLRLMFSPVLCDQSDAALQQAAKGSYAVLARIAKGLKFDKADTPDADRRAELMLWSLAHGYAMLSLSGMVNNTGAAVDIADIMPDLNYHP